MNSSEKVKLDKNDLKLISAWADDISEYDPEVSENRLWEIEERRNSGLWVMFDCIFEYSYEVKVRRSWRLFSEVTREKNYIYEEDVEFPVIDPDVASELIGARANSHLGCLAYLINEHFDGGKYDLPTELSSSSFFDPLNTEDLEEQAKHFENRDLIGRSVEGYEGREQELSSIRKKSESKGDGYYGPEPPWLRQVILTSSPKFKMNGQPIADEKFDAYLSKAAETFPDISNFQ